MLLAVVRERADEAKSEVSDAAKAALNNAITAVDAYKVSARGADAAAEKTAAKKVADEVLAAIKKAKTL